MTAIRAVTVLMLLTIQPSDSLAQQGAVSDSPEVRETRYECVSKCTDIEIKACLPNCYVADAMAACVKSCSKMDLPSMRAFLHWCDPGNCK